MLGVPDELVKVTCTRKPAQEGGIEGLIVTLVEFPASTTLPSVLAFTELTIEDTVEGAASCLTQGTSWSDEGPLRAPEDDRVPSTSLGPRPQPYP